MSNSVVSRTQRSISAHTAKRTQGESLIQNLQKEVDYYTRQLEQEKKYF